ncbi:NAD(P)/FAD-dependent oxidoreductase [Piscinibacter sakaiensis]|uniref:NAD(FAD)-utilizing dehydrogenases n=1 Tax=Piscinibacter sakaiensis TaxID=1547922 RepID=A0A0K8NWH5_PISS1|nr:NAD(P)/FAD-dependent oxidoreductase [Piscinibacter sakaiensis]GAP34747.1 NAD(FAD)-utilizing dehydrogenases [Piscinibacter sakaiensis]
MADVDVVILGAGAAGLFCAGMAGQLGLRVLVLDHAERVAEKIRISGGGRCNFTNREVGPGQFLSANPDFCRSALARYTPADFIALMQRHRLGFHEKHLGQLFCDDGSEAVIAMLLRECDAGGVSRWQPCPFTAVRTAGNGFEVDTARGTVRAARVVVATGGLSIPKIGATDAGHRLARHFGHRIVEPRPALVPLSFAAADWAPYAALAGTALPAEVRTGQGRGAGRFVEDLLFTHRGLSGPAILQISSYWRPGAPLHIDLAPGQALDRALVGAKAGAQRQLGTVLAEHLPRRLAQAWLAPERPGAAAFPPPQRPLAECRDRDLTALAASLQAWSLVPDGTEGYRKAEVTAGGVDTRELQSASLESRRQPGLHFIGEVVDVTGWLGGYNFQWAWASAAACARAMAAAAPARDRPAGT